MSMRTWVHTRYGFISPIRPKLREVEVLVDIEDVDEIVSAYYEEAQRKYVGPNVLNILDIDSVKKYITMLIALRVDFVNRTRKYKEYDLRTYQVPAFVAALLMPIGPADDQEFGIHLKPKCEEPKEKLTPDDMRKISRVISALKDAFRPVFFPLRREGDVSFMSKFVIENEVRSYRGRDHVYDAFLTAITKKHIIDDVILQLSTVHYGSVEVFRRELPISEDYEYAGQDSVPPQPSD